MHFYGMSDEQVLAMPIQRFHGGSAMIDRLQADEQIRHLTVLGPTCFQDSDAFKRTGEDLNRRRGTVYIVEDDAPEPGAFDKLRNALSS